MQRYDPLQQPDPEEWLALDEQERLALVKDYHRRARIRVPNLALHVVLHEIVENQIALADQTPAQRLMIEGLDRHVAIHAIGTVLMEHISKVAKEQRSGDDANAVYFAELERLTAEGWRRIFDEA